MAEDTHKLFKQKSTKGDVEDDFTNCVFYCQAIARNLNEVGIEIDLESIT